jgi:alkylation response protein AidB-like acyl-CoA dehydrogenase
MADAVTRAGLLARVQHLAPVIREHADRGERERHLADPVVQALHDAGFYRMLVPRALGGLQVDPLTLYHVVEAVARLDGSTGWCLFINGCAPISAALLGAEAAAAIYGPHTPTIMAGTTFPRGRAVPCPGGYRVASRGAYASGCWHSTWYLAFCHIYDDGATAPWATPTGEPEVVVVHLPRAQIQILDTWDVSGLVATGSHDVLVEDVFVPDAFVWQLQPQMPRGPHFSGVPTSATRCIASPAWACSPGRWRRWPWGSRSAPSMRSPRWPWPRPRAWGLAPCASSRSSSCSSRKPWGSCALRAPGFTR